MLYFWANIDGANPTALWGDCMTIKTYGVLYAGQWWCGDTAPHCGAGRVWPSDDDAEVAIMRALEMALKARNTAFKDAAAIDAAIDEVKDKEVRVILSDYAAKIRREAQLAMPERFEIFPIYGNEGKAIETFKGWVAIPKRAR